MRELTPEQFGRVEKLFFEAGKLPQDEWPSFLDARCGDDPLVRDELHELLEHHSKAGGVNSAAILPIPSAASGTDIFAMVGRQIGAYEFIEVIGRGGMGVVYRARDSRLGRAVAVKAIPAALGADHARLHRFQREARLLASLSHPNIATVYGLEEAEGSQFLVMELMEGPTLSERLKKGALSFEDAFSAGALIAAGVEAAHEAGVIHRDLKPGNVMFTSDGRVKVLDFGLARELRSPVSFTGPTQLIEPKDRAQPVTGEGAIVGTPGYISPEQLRGQSVDRRTDIFAFGCILYECLTGRPAFGGQSSADSIASALEREPDWAALPARTPPAVKRLLAKCTAKDPTKRIRDMGDVRLELEDALETQDWLAPEPITPEAERPSAWRITMRVAPWAIAAIFLIALVVAIATRRAPVQTAKQAATIVPPVSRFAVAFPNNYPQSNLAHLRLALTRDGSRLVLSASDGKEHYLWQRGRGDTEFRRIEGTRDGWLPSISPDGEWLVYLDRGALSKRRITGGDTRRIVEANAYWSASLAPDGTIYYVPFWSKGVARVPAYGTTPTYVTMPTYKERDFAHLSPVATPDGAALLFGVWDGQTATRIDVITLATSARHTVVEQGSSPRLAQTPRGMHLLYERGGVIFATPFDLATLRCTGPETAIADGVTNDRVYFTAFYDVADDGTLVYIPGPTFSEESRLSWLDLATQTTTPMNDDRLSFVEPHFSQDGRWLSVVLKSDVFRPAVYDLKLGTLNPVVTDGDTEAASVSPDGTMLAYTNNRSGPYCVYLRQLSNRHEEKLTEALGDYQVPMSWSPDGQHLLFSAAPDPKSSRDIFYLNVKEKRTHPFCDSAAEERGPSMSPDGKWVAYASNQSGTREVYVRSFPDGKVTRQVSFGGGDWPMWAPPDTAAASDVASVPTTTKSLPPRARADQFMMYFRAKSGLCAVPLSKSDCSVADRPTLLYDKDFGQADYDLPDYTIAPDGRILLVEASERGPTVAQMHMILNWPQLLDRRLDDRSTP